MNEPFSHPVPLSAVILCRNEAVNLERCIRALHGCGEIVVVDDGSTDGSAAAARAAGARVVENRFVSFAEQRNWAMAQAGLAYDWVLHLDADEVMTPAGLDELRGLLPALDPRRVGFVARQMMLGEQWLRFSADYPVYVPRLLHRAGPRFVMRGHGETVATLPDQPVFLREPLRHYMFSKGWPDWWERHRRYARAEALRLADGLPEFSWARLFSSDPNLRRGAARALSYRLPGRPLLRFLYAYGVRFGFLDGRSGWAYCRAMAKYEGMINRELRALRKEPAGCTSR